MIRVDPGRYQIVKNIPKVSVIVHDDRNSVRLQTLHKSFKRI